ncbi:putative short chain protein [Eutypa lata UCREL1]|uniref:Putative short chain protein n=1 Tax=Eutypa lata (strain UCR-EL1) TaxID=1287681 RepID=M7SKL4_EUTLA|nr:putative short chain protein [Eutypa lata UCREL1]
MPNHVNPVSELGEAMALPTKPLHDKIALVSGSSSGIGAAIAKELSTRGATVVVNYPNASEEASARAVLETLSGNVGDGRAASIILKADLATVEGPKQLAAAVAARYGKLDILVNNAGRSILCDLSEGSDSEVERAWDNVINLNGRGTLLLTRAVLPLLSPSGSRIVNVGSSTSRDPDPHMSIYAGSKGMVESFTRCWARDLSRKHGCTVNTVAPGPVATDALLAAPANFLEHLRTKWDSVPAGARFARPEEVAWVVAELCDERAAWLNGLYIPVTGGFTLS